MSLTLVHVHEWRFVNPATIVDGKDARGRAVIGIWAPDGPGPEIANKPAFSMTWSEFVAHLAEQQEKFATQCELDMQKLGHLHYRNCQEKICRCAFIAADARSATRTEVRTHVAKIEVK